MYEGTRACHDKPEGWSIRMTMSEIFKPSEDVVTRHIEGETIIIPLVAGIGDMEEELYSLNTSGQAIWEKLDGKRSLAVIVDELAAEYDASLENLRQDVGGLIEELARRRLIVPVEE